MLPFALKTKYAFHALLWLLKPDAVLDVGSMDGADSKRFQKLLKRSEIIAFEANPDNFRLMSTDQEIAEKRIRLENQLVSCAEGTRSFYIQRPDKTHPGVNRGTSSALPRTEPGMKNEEVLINSVRLDSFLDKEFPQATKIALWIDVEGFAYEVLESMQHATDHIQLIHVEVETRECWPGQRLESDVLELLEGMGYVLLAQGKHDIQRDLILVSRSWLDAVGHRRINNMMRMSRWIGPTLSRALTCFPS